MLGTGYAKLGEATEGGDVLCNLQIPFIFIQQRILAIFTILFPVFMHEAQTNLPVSSSMGIHPGELLALSSWARTTVLQGTEICISGLHETVLCRCRRLSTASKRTEGHQSRVAKGADWLKILQSFECSSPCI